MWGVADLTAYMPSREEIYDALCLRHGAELQEKISSASVAVCGLGGLGSNIAVMLARSGIGRLHLIDFDMVEISNINRQQYMLDQIGLYKTEALKDTLRKISPYIRIDTDTVKITESNAEELLEDDGIICEAFDSAEEKAMLADIVLCSMPEKYLIAGSGMAGISSANDIVTEKITGRFFICGDQQSDIISCGKGLFAPRVTVCAAHQANAVLQIIAGETDL